MPRSPARPDQGCGLCVYLAGLANTKLPLRFNVFNVILDLALQLIHVLTFLFKSASQRSLLQLLGTSGLSTESERIDLVYFFIRGHLFKVAFFNYAIVVHLSFEQLLFFLLNDFEILKLPDKSIHLLLLNLGEFP